MEQFTNQQSVQPISTQSNLELTPQAQDGSESIHVSADTLVSLASTATSSVVSTSLPALSDTSTPHSVSSVAAAASVTTTVNSAQNNVSQSSVQSLQEALNPVLPSATVGSIEVDGVQIEMLSLAQLKANALVLEEVQKAAKAAKAQKTKVARKTRKSKTSDLVDHTEGEEKAKRPRRKKTEPQEQVSQESAEAKIESNLSSKLDPQSQTALSSEENTQSLVHHEDEASLLQANDAHAGGSAVCKAAQNSELLSSNLEQADSENQAQGALSESQTQGAEGVLISSLTEETSPNAAQTLLNRIIAHVEHFENQASQVDDDVLTQQAEAALESSSTLTFDESVTNNLVQTEQTETQWEEFEELSEEQMEHYRQMGLQEGDICPVCSNGILTMRHSFKSDFLGCSNFPVCKFHLFTGKRSAVTTLKELSSLCPVCHGNLEVKKGRFGIFIGCSNYPSCNYVYHREDSGSHKEIDCPVCGKGKLVERRGRNGRSFYGCNCYPECSFSVFGVPVEEKCPDCGFPVMYKKKTKQGTALICGNPLCSSRRKRTRRLVKA